MLWTAPPPGTEVPWMWELLRLPRFRGAIQADSYDNRSPHLQVGLPRQQSRGHRLDGELAMRLLKHGAEVDHRVDVLAVARVNVADELARLGNHHGIQTTRRTGMRMLESNRQQRHQPSDIVERVQGEAGFHHLVDLIGRHPFARTLD